MALPLRVVKRDWLLSDQRKPKTDFLLKTGERVSGGNAGE